MIGYVTLGTNDLPRAAAFYDSLLAVIGALLAWGLWQQRRIADLQWRLEQMQSTSEASGKPPD